MLGVGAIFAWAIAPIVLGLLVTLKVASTKGFPKFFVIAAGILAPGTLVATLFFAGASDKAALLGFNYMAGIATTVAYLFRDRASQNQTIW